MATHKTNELCEQAALYILGVLKGDELVVYKNHLDHGCTVCEAELKGFQFVADQLSYSPPIVTPPPTLRDRLLKRVKNEALSDSQNKSIDIQTGLTFVRTADKPWQEIQPGIQLKLLFIDKKQGRMTALARMEPDTTYAAHRHTTAEEFYILEGTCDVDGQLLQTGDYHRAEADSIHYKTATKDGCLMLIIFSPDNEMLEQHV